jgi:hypothetical protein
MAPQEVYRRWDLGQAEKAMDPGSKKESYMGSKLREVKRLADNEVEDLISLPFF